MSTATTEGRGTAITTTARPLAAITKRQYHGSSRQRKRKVVCQDGSVARGSPVDSPRRIPAFPGDDPRAAFGVAGVPKEPIVKTEELCIVIVVLLLWVAAIALFINKWGKIRGTDQLTAYFEEDKPADESVDAPSTVQQQHRASVAEGGHPKRVSVTLFNGSAACEARKSRRPSNLSTAAAASMMLMPPSPPTAAFPADRRLSVFAPEAQIRLNRGTAQIPQFPKPNPSKRPSIGGSAHHLQLLGNSLNLNLAPPPQSALLTTTPRLSVQNHHRSRRSSCIAPQLSRPPSFSSAALLGVRRASYLDVSPEALSDGSISRRASVCMAAEALMAAGMKDKNSSASSSTRAVNSRAPPLGDASCRASCSSYLSPPSPMPPVEKLRLPSLLPTVQCISPTPDVAVTHATVECNRFFPVLASVSSSGEENTTVDEGQEEQIASQEQSIPTLNSTLGVPDEVFAGRELDEIKPDFHGAPEIRPNSIQRQRKKGAIAESAKQDPPHRQHHRGQVSTHSAMQSDV